MHSTEFSLQLNFFLNRMKNPRGTTPDPKPRNWPPVHARHQSVAALSTAQNRLGVRSGSPQYIDVMILSKACFFKITFKYCLSNYLK